MRGSVFVLFDMADQLFAWEILQTGIMGGIQNHFIHYDNISCMTHDVDGVIRMNLGFNGAVMTMNNASHEAFELFRTAWKAYHVENRPLDAQRKIVALEQKMDAILSKLDALLVEQ